jgi:hypothetical protein
MRLETTPATLRNGGRRGLYPRPSIGVQIIIGFTIKRGTYWEVYLLQNKWREKRRDEKTTGSAKFVDVHYESVYYIISTWYL